MKYCQARETNILIKKNIDDKPYSDHRLREAQGNLLNMNYKRLDRQSDYFNKLLNKAPPTIDHSQSTPKTALKNRNTLPDLPEIKEAIKNLKIVKAPKSDNIQQQIHQQMLMVELDFPTKILQILAYPGIKEKLPKRWKNGLILKIQKQKITNWRSISLLLC